MARRKKRPSRSRSCEGKDKLTERQAKARAKALRAQGAIVHKYRCVYPCYTDNGTRAWHVGHPAMRRRKE